MHNLHISKQLIYIEEKNKNKYHYYYYIYIYIRKNFLLNASWEDLINIPSSILLYIPSSTLFINNNIHHLMNIYNIHNLYYQSNAVQVIYTTFLCISQSKRVVDENNSSSFSFFTPYYKRYEDDHAKHTNKNEHGSYVPEYIDIIDYKKYTKQKIY